MINHLESILKRVWTIAKKISILRQMMLQRTGKKLTKRESLEFASNMNKTDLENILRLSINNLTSRTIDS
jgi:hypothetical protein